MFELDRQVITYTYIHTHTYIHSALLFAGEESQSEGSLQGGGEKRTVSVSPHNLCR